MNEHSEIAPATCRGKSAAEWPRTLDALQACTSDEWLGEIRRLYARGKEGTFQLAYAVHSAKSRLRRGEWARLWRSGNVPFAKSKGEMLAKIGQQFGIPNVQAFACLPSGWSILHQLARLDRAKIDELIETGTIHPALTYTEARDL